MKYLTEFKKNESGAVTVDWVVLTAAIVGIALAVIALISGGIEDVSTGINDELQTASAFSFSFGSSATAGTLTGYYAEYGDDAAAIYDAINNDAPEEYEYVGAIDVASDTAIYADTETGETLSINGEIVSKNDYLGSGALYEGFGPVV